MGVAKWCGTMALALGAVGFAAGFFGPMVLDPSSPQGPLLGLLITGPGGVVVGAAAGLVIGLVRQRSAAEHGVAADRGPGSE